MTPGKHIAWTLVAKRPVWQTTSAQSGKRKLTGETRAAPKPLGVAVRSSYLDRLRYGRYVQVRAEWAQITGSPSSGVVIGVFDGLMRMEKHDGQGWIRLSYRQLTEESCGLLGRKAIDTAVERLIELGYLEREQLDGSRDRTFHWRLNVRAICEAVRAIAPADPWAIVPAGTAQLSDSPNGTVSGGADLAEASQGVKSFKEVGVKDQQDVREVWELYRRLIGKHRAFETAHRQLIERALKACELETVKRAIVGLSLSPHHNGENERSTTYLDLRYALKPKSGESVQDRVEYMAQFAPLSTSEDGTVSLGTRDRGVWEGVVQTHKDKVRLPYNAAKRREVFEHEIKERDEAIVALEGFGIRTILGDDGRPIFEDIEGAVA